MTNRVAAVYAIRHLQSGALYIGSTVDLAARWAQHRTGLRAGFHSNKHLQALYDSAVPIEGQFALEVLEAISDPSELGTVEAAWIKRCLAQPTTRLLNVLPGANRNGYSKRQYERMMRSRRARDARTARRS